MKDLRYPTLLEAWDYEGRGDAPMLWGQMQDMSVGSPLYGISILHSLPLTLATVCKIHVLLEAGAHIEVYKCSALSTSAQKQAESLLSRVGVPVFDSLLEGSVYDFHMDCAATLRSLPPPRQGIIEITQTGSEFYRGMDLPVPVISVDDSRIKSIETGLGTSEAFLRSFSELTGECVEHHRYVVFGYGKVGRGIVYRLLQRGADVSVVTRTPASALAAREKGVQAVSIGEKDAVARSIKEASVIVTATGVAQCISNHVERSLLDGRILINMGVLDEFGASFSDSEILNCRRPINFASPCPTCIRYLEISFYAHNRGVLHILGNRLCPGFYPYPRDDANKIVTMWEGLHNERMPEI